MNINKKKNIKALIICTAIIIISVFISGLILNYIYVVEFLKIILKPAKEQTSQILGDNNIYNKITKIVHPLCRDTLFVRCLKWGDENHPKFKVIITSDYIDKDSANNLNSYVFNETNSVRYYMFTDSSIVLFVNHLVRKPILFDSRIKIEQVIETSNNDTLQRRYKEKSIFEFY